MLGRNAGRETTSTERTVDASMSSSTIGQGMTVRGECTTDGHVRVEGTIGGDLSAAGLELTSTGVIEGAAQGTTTGRDGRPFVVGGRITGKVTARFVEVLATGVVLGGIEADDVTIHGQVEGGVVAKRRLAIAETAVVNGEVRTQRMTMQEGGRVNGTIRMSPRVEAGGTATKESVAA